MADEIFELLHNDTSYMSNESETSVVIVQAKVTFLRILCLVTVRTASLLIVAIQRSTKKTASSVPIKTLMAKLLTIGRRRNYQWNILIKSMIRKLTVSTNHYAAQREISLNSTCEEIEQYIGILLHMGTVWMPDIRGYWKPETRYPPIADVMSRTRFLQIKSNFHISDNTETNYESESYDRLLKVRELYDHVQANCKKLDVPEYLSIG